MLQVLRILHEGLPAHLTLHAWFTCTSSALLAGERAEDSDKQPLPPRKPLEVLAGIALDISARLALNEAVSWARSAAAAEGRWAGLLRLERAAVLPVGVRYHSRQSSFDAQECATSPPDRSPTLVLSNAICGCNTCACHFLQLACFSSITGTLSYWLSRPASVKSFSVSPVAGSATGWTCLPSHLRTWRSWRRLIRRRSSSQSEASGSPQYNHCPPLRSASLRWPAVGVLDCVIADLHIALEAC